MNRLRLVLLIVCSSAISAGLASWAAIKMHDKREVSHEHSEDSGGDFHQWIHAQLDLTPEQEEALAGVESEFQINSERLEKSLSAAGHGLAHAIKDHGRGSPELSAALSRINRLQLELQELTIDHFFDMEKNLDPDQARKLFEWTHDSISESH